MAFKIGFLEDTPKNTTFVSEKRESYKYKGVECEPKRSLVDVYFPVRNLTCTYFNDKFDLKKGDIVWVDGKLEGLRGRVVEVNYAFKIKLSDYKRVIGVADTKVGGEFFVANSHVFTLDEDAIPFEKVLTWFKAPTFEEEEFVSGDEEGESFSLDELGKMKVSPAIAERGHDYYLEGRVAYIEIDNCKGRAIVLGTKPYEVEFDIEGREISSLVCNCFCSGACKHAFATMLELREIIKSIDENYGDCFDFNYIAVINKETFFKYVVENMGKGKFNIENS